MGRLLRVGTKGVLGTGQDYGLLVDLQEVASAAVAALGAMEQRYGRFVVSDVDSYAQALDPFDLPDSRLGLASLSDDLEEATDLLELESAPELARSPLPLPLGRSPERAREQSARPGGNH